VQKRGKFIIFEFHFKHFMLEKLCTQLIFAFKLLIENCIVFFITYYKDYWNCKRSL